MEGIAFIVALCVGAVLMAWYVANEAHGADGEVGLLAIAAAGGDDAKERPQQSRYRIRPRLVPGPRAGLHATAPQKAYRVTPPGRPSYRATAEDTAEADKEY